MEHIIDSGEREYGSPIVIRGENDEPLMVVQKPMNNGKGKICDNR